MKNWNNLFFQKIDQGSTIGILDQGSYLKSVETLQIDSLKFKNIPLAPDVLLNYVIISEKKVTNLLEKLVENVGKKDILRLFASQSLISYMLICYKMKVPPITSTVLLSTAH